MPRSSTDTPHPVDVYVGARVCAMRMQRGMNQSQLGAALGISFQQVQKYEGGANRISASKLFDIATALRVPFGYFVDGYGAGQAVEDAKASAALTRSGRRIVDALSKLTAANVAALAVVVEAMRAGE